MICSELIPFVWLFWISLPWNVAASWAKTRIHSESRRLMTERPLSPGPCQKIFWGVLSPVSNSTGTAEPLMWALLKICGCLLFQESEVLNSAPSMSGVEPGHDQRFRWSWSCGEEVKPLCFPASLKLCPFFGSLKCFQGIRVATDPSLISCW